MGSFRGHYRRRCVRRQVRRRRDLPVRLQLVVGDGKGVANAEVVSVEPFEQDSKPASRAVADGEGFPAGMLAAVGIVGLATGAAVALALARFGRKGAAA